MLGALLAFASVHGFALHAGALRSSQIALTSPQAVPVRTASAPVMSTRGIVITGGAGGVGYAYADSFMKRGHWVVICDVKDPSSAVEALRKKHEGSIARVHGCVCDVSDAASVEKLGEFAQEKLGTIHYWINNAGINGGRRPFTTLSTSTVEAVVKVNLIGILLCTKVALDIMQKQKGVESHIFNTVGSGVKGGGTPGYVAYGATKRGLPQMTDSLVKELTTGVPGFDVEPPLGKVNCHTLSPGMVFTDLLLNDSTPELRKFPFGVLAAQPEEVGEDLVPKILAIRCMSACPCVFSLQTSFHVRSSSKLCELVLTTNATARPAAATARR
jgi:chlorophyll(ide) b reductase